MKISRPYQFKEQKKNKEDEGGGLRTDLTPRMRAASRRVMEAWKPPS